MGIEWQSNNDELAKDPEVKVFLEEIKPEFEAARLNKIKLIEASDQESILIGSDFVLSQEQIDQAVTFFDNETRESY